MIEIYLDNKRAIPVNGSSIKLTTENVYFTKSASYTYEIEFPLAIKENRAIFWHMHRLDVSKEQHYYDAKLVVDNVTLLTGLAHITSITETSVKVQLLGEAASYNYGNKMDDVYIDELDLGDWFWVTFPDGSHWNHLTQQWDYYSEDKKFTGSYLPLAYRISEKEIIVGYNPEVYKKVFSGEYPWVAYPVYNSSSDSYLNTWAFENYNGEYVILGVPNAIQPFVWVMAQLIAKATGYTLAKDNNALYTNEFFRKIFIVNANNFIECNKCLPHWTVNNWWTQVENTFGVVMSIDYEKKEMKLSARGDFYNNDNLTILKDIVDEYSVEVDSDDEEDISVSNVGYADFENDLGDLLSEYILNNATINEEYESIESLFEWAKAQGEETMESYKHVLWKCKDGRQYIYASDTGNGEAGMVEVNMFRPRLTNESKDIDIELGFVPAAFVEMDSEAIVNPFGTNNDIATFKVKVLSVPNLSEIADPFSEGEAFNIDIENLINEVDSEDDDDDEMPDVIYIAISDIDNFDHINESLKSTLGHTINIDGYFPRAKLRERIVAPLSGSITKEDSPYGLSLNKIEGQTSLMTNTIGNDIAIDAKIKQCIKFVSEKLPDPTSTFLIRNKRFVCEKMEATINSNGLDKLITGYFYEIS